jgi:CheY-like chemotaxis protein
MDDLSTNATADYSYNESKKISCSFDSRYYDEIITRLRLQSREQEYEYGIPQQQREKPHQEEELSDQKRTKRILLVDDEPDTCMVYQIVLQDAGFECVSYTDSVKALQEFRPSYYDLILLDIKMPVLNGFELCKRIRELDKTIQVIFITASEGYYEQLRRQSFPELTNDSNINYVQKPIGNEELVRLINIRMLQAIQNKNS